MHYTPFEEEITREGIEGLLVTLRSANAPRGIYIDSPGGEFEFFSELGPAIERQGIVTLSEDVRSSAVVLALLGHRRQAFVDSAFFFHEVRAFVRTDKIGEISIADVDAVLDYEDAVMSGQPRETLQEWRRQMVSAQDWFTHFVGQRTGLAPGIFRNLMTAEAMLTAKEAQRYGIVHEIVDKDRVHIC